MRMRSLNSFLTALLLTTLPALAQTGREGEDQMPPQGMRQGSRCPRGGRGAGGR